MKVKSEKPRRGPYDTTDEWRLRATAQAAAELRAEAPRDNNK